MTPLDALRTYAFLGLPVGLATGLLLALVARREGGWGGYGSFRRRAARLGHVALVMLPLIGGFYALALEGRPHGAGALAWAVPLWIAGGLGLVAALFAAAWRPSLVVALPAPALATSAGAALFASAWFGG
jgi:hypothetical protein